MKIDHYNVFPTADGFFMWKAYDERGDIVQRSNGFFTDKEATFADIKKWDEENIKPAKKPAKKKTTKKKTAKKKTTSK